MSSQFSKWSVGVIAALWILWVILTFLGFHPTHLQLFQEYPYPGVFSVLGLVVMFLGGYSYRRLSKKKKWYLSIRGIHLIGATLLLGLFFILRFKAVVGLDFSDNGTTFIYYLINSIWYVLLLLVLGLCLLALGDVFTKRLEGGKKNDAFRIAVGIMVLGVFSALLGTLHILYGIVLWAVLLAAVFFQRKLVLATLKNWLWEKHRWRLFHWWQLPLLFLSLFFLALYWVGGIKAFATGFDGAALYANLAKLVAEKHALPGAYQAFGWSVVMSWGQLLFGSLTFSLLLSHFVFLPALILAYSVLRNWLKSSYAFLSIFLVMSLPMFSFQAMVDEKVDFGLLLISLAAVFLVLQYKFSKTESAKFVWRDLFSSSRYYPYLLLGALLGFAFSIKYTAVFLVVAVLGLLFYRLGKSLLFWGWMIFFVGFIFLSGFYLWGNLPLTNNEAFVLGLVMSIAGIAIMAYRFFAIRSKARSLLYGLVVLGSSFLLVFSPWAGKHLAERDYKFSVSSIIYGKPDRISIEVAGKYLSDRVNNSPFENGVLKTPALLTNEQSTPQSSAASNMEEDTEEDTGMIGNAQREELQRYLGYEKGIWRYLTIPFDLSFNLNVPGLRHQEISFFWLALFPLLFLGFGRSAWLRNGVIVVVGLLLITASFWSLAEAGTSEAQVNGVNSVLNRFSKAFPGLVDSSFLGLWQQVQQPFIILGSYLIAGFELIANIPTYVFIPLLLLIFFGVGQSFRKKAKHWPTEKKETGLLLIAFLSLWVLLGNSISWYAMLVIVLLPSWLIYVLQQARSSKEEKKRLGVLPLMIGVTVGLQLLLNTAILMSSSQLGQAKAQLYNWPMVQYLCSNDLDQTKTLGLFDPYSEQIVEALNREDDSRIYKVNTYLQFHVEHNDTRVLEDNQLQKFDQIQSITENDADFFKVLKENDFAYILYDLNTPSLDQTPEKSLVAKCNKFMQSLLSSPDVELIVTDNFVAAPPGSANTRLPNGQTAAAVQGLNGQTVHRGRVALFRLK